MNNVKETASKIGFYIVLGLIPMVLWVLGLGEQPYFADTYSVMSMLGKAAGIVGISFFAGNLILSGRYRALDAIFGGLDRVYLFHRRTGIIAFILLTLHVVMIAGRRLTISWESFAAFLFDTSINPVFWGRIGYYGLFIILAITLYSTFYTGKKYRLTLKYETLKYLHSYLGAFLFFGGLHAFLIPSDIARNLPLRWYVLAIVALAFISYLYRTVFKRWLVARGEFNVTEVNALNASVTEVVMRPVRAFRTFTPGQFIFVTFRQAGFPREDHPFSLTASPEEGRYRISAKALGDFTTALKSLKPGTTALVQGPFGGFSFLNIKNRKQLWIAGGIGITPFISMARTIRDRAGDELVATYRPHLVYSTMTEADMVYKAELESIAQAGQLAFSPWATDRQGLLTAEAIRAVVPDILDRDIFICGPKPMLEALRKQCIALGIPASRIHYELFKLL